MLTLLQLPLLTGLGAGEWSPFGSAHTPSFLVMWACGPNRRARGERRQPTRKMSHARHEPMGMDRCTALHTILLVEPNPPFMIPS
jgi:hypothetical protein